MRLLVNNVEQQQPRNSDAEIVLFGRNLDAPNEVTRVTVVGFEPYLYARADEVRADENFILSHDCVKRVEYNEEWRSLREEHELARVYTPKPQDGREAKEIFDETWAADVPFTNRFRIDTGLEAVVDVPDTRCHWREIEPVREADDADVTPRVCTLDIEVDDRGEDFPVMGKERVLSIVAHDSVVDEMIAFIDFDGSPPDDFTVPENIDRVHWGRSEEDMFDHFVHWLTEHDPDLITGWNVDGFDVPFIIKRMEELDLDPGELSRMGWSGVTNFGPRIKGRTVYDLLTVYKKNAFTELRSYKLDYVAKEELGEEKIEFEGSFFELYENDAPKFLEYNAHDVWLTKEINRVAGTIEFRDVLRREVGVDFEDSYDNKDFVDMMCRRELKVMGRVGPTRGHVPDSDFEGAWVFPAYTGVAENVVGIDLASLYPYTMGMVNASPETLVDPDEYDGEVIEAANGAYFKRDVDGLFKRLVDKAIALKSEYKKLRDSAENDAEYARYSTKYNSAKTITNSLYGVTGWDRFFLYDKTVAEAVTLTGQAVIKGTAEYVESQGYEVIYGDTDSTYVRLPQDWDMETCLTKAQELCATLNEEIYTEMAAARNIPERDWLWEIELEVYMDRFFQAGRKKRYAYRAIWKDGRLLDEPYTSVTGFSSKRSDTSQLTERAEREIFDAILNDRIDEIDSIIYEAAKQIRATDPPWELIGIPGGLGQKIDPAKAGSDGYYAFHEDGYPQDAHPRAAWNSNHLLHTQFGSGSKPMRAYLQPVWMDELDRKINVIAYESESDLRPIEDDITLDVPRMIQTLIVKPLDRIVSAVGVDVTAAVRGQTQTGLGMFTADGS